MLRIKVLFLMLAICLIMVLAGTQAPLLAAQGKNLFPGDTSFETGAEPWISWTSAYAGNWGVDAATAYHGKKSLRVAYPTQLEAYRFKLEKGRSYTLSFYMKTDKPGAPCSASIWTRNPETGKDATHGIWNAAYGTEWKRYSFTIPPLNFTTDDWRMIVIPQKSDANFWIDAIQLEEGALTDYHHPERFSIVTGEPGNIYTCGKLNTVKINLYNGTVRNSLLTLSYNIADYNGKSVLKGTKQVDMKGNASFTLPISLPATFDKGFYTISASITNDGKVIYEDKTFFCVVPPVSPTRKTQGFMGTSDYMGQASEEQMESLAKIGSRWLNLPLRRTWKSIEPEKGKFNWQGMDRDVEFAKKYGFNIVGYIYSGEDAGIPAWAAMDSRRIRPRNMEDFSDYVYNMVSRYKDSIKVWDVLSEPDLGVKYTWGTDSASAYAQFLKAGYDGAKRADPNCIFAGCSVTSNDAGTGYLFAKAVLKDIGPNLDGIAPHPYMYPRTFGPGLAVLGPTEGGLAKYLQNMVPLAQGKHMWIGEYGFSYHCRPDSIYAKNMAAYMAQSLIIVRSIKEIERFLWFNSYHRFWTNSGESYGMWTDAFIPMPTTAVFANIANLLEPVTDRKHLNMGKSVECYIFQSGKDAVAAIWAPRIAKDISIDIPRNIRLKVLNVVGSSLPASQTGRLPLTESPVFLVMKNASMNQLEQFIFTCKINTPLAIKADVYTTDDSALQVFATSLAAERLEAGLNVSCPLPLINPTTTFTLKPGETKVIEFPLKDSKFIPGPNYKISLNITAAGQRVDTNKILTFLESRTPERMTDKPFAALSYNNLVPVDAAVHHLWTGDDDLSAKAYLANDDKNLYLTVKVLDDKHINNKLLDKIWDGDALQIAIDAGGDAVSPEASGYTGYDQNDIELGLALTKSGIQAYRWMPNAGVISSREMKYNVTRDGNFTNYEITIPYSSLPSFGEYKNGRVIGISFVLFDDDGNGGQEYWMELTRGVAGGRKDPSMFRKVILK
jgi:hypothetical protein